MPDPPVVQMQHAVRLAKQDDQGRYLEFVTIDAAGRIRVIRPDEDPRRFAALVAAERAGAPAS
jgi:hypothetical protein